MSTARAKATELGSPVKALRPRRVLHVVPQMGSGGAERVVLDLMRAADGETCSSRLCVLGSTNTYPRKDAFPETPAFLGYDGSLRNLRGLRRCVRALRRLIVEWEADIVHSHLWPAARVSSLATARTCTRHLVHVHDAWPWLRDPSLRCRIMRTFTRRTVRASRPTFVCVARTVRDYNLSALAFHDLPTFIVENGVDTTVFRPQTLAAKHGGHLRIGMVARFSPEKGHQDLLHAIAKLVAEGNKMDLHLAGDGGMMEHCRRLTIELGINDVVKFHGLVADVPSFLRSMDAFVLPSHSEGLPLTVLEAMASGLPVIASAVGAVPEVISHDKNGLLFPPRSINTLANAIRRLLQDDELRSKLGAAALRTVRERFSFDFVTRRMAEIYVAITSAGIP